MPVENGGAVAAPDPVLVEFQELVHRAGEEGDAAMPAVRAFLDSHPNVWRTFGDLGRSAQLSLIERANGGQPALMEVMMRRARELEGQLAPGASALEKVLAAQVVTCWLAAAEAELTAAGSTALGKPIPLSHMEFLDRRRDRASKRLESAAKTLAVVRKLLTPAPAPMEVATRLDKRAARAATRQLAPAMQPAGVNN